MTLLERTSQVIFVQGRERGEGRSSEGIWGKSLPSRRNKKYKTPEAGMPGKLEEKQKGQCTWSREVSQRSQLEWAL